VSKKRAFTVILAICLGCGLFFGIREYQEYQDRASGRREQDDHLNAVSISCTAPDDCGGSWGMRIDMRLPESDRIIELRKAIAPMFRSARIPKEGHEFMGQLLFFRTTAFDREGNRWSCVQNGMGYLELRRLPDGTFQFMQIGPVACPRYGPFDSPAQAADWLLRWIGGEWNGESAQAIITKEDSNDDSADPAAP